MWFARSATSKSRSALATLIAFVAGVGLHSLVAPDRHWYPTALAGLGLFCFALVLWFWDAPPRRFVALIGFALLVGVARFDAVIPYGTRDEIGFFLGSRIAIHGVVASDPQFKINRLEFVVDTIVPGRGSILVRAPLSTTARYGDIFDFSCALEERPRDRMVSCSNPGDMKLVGTAAGNVVRARLFDLKHQFTRAITQTFPEPQAGLLRGILFGDHALPSSVAADFRTTGVSHIVAASGYNIGMVSRSLFWLLFWLPGINYRRAFWLVLAGLIAYTLIAGAEAAVVRAAVMGVLVLVAGQVGRRSRMVNVLALAGALMLAVNPRLLVADVGFYLSFAATCGIVFLSPALKERYGKMFARTEFWRTVSNLFFDTVSAIAVTLPIVLWVFGQFSLVALPANLLIVFVVPFAMAAGFGVAVLALVSPTLAQPLAWIVWAPLTYMIHVAHRFASIPFASLATGVLSRAAAAVSVLALVWWIIRIRRSDKPEPLPGLSEWQIETV